MVRFQFFPRSIGVVKPIEDVLNAFKNVESEIDSKTSNKKSDDVLAAVEPYLTKLKYNVEKGNYSAVVRMVCYGLVSLWNFLENHLK